MICSTRVAYITTYGGVADAPPKGVERAPLVLAYLPFPVERGGQCRYATERSADNALGIPERSVPVSSDRSASRAQYFFKRRM